MKNNNRAFSLIELSIVILIIGILIAGVTQGSRLVDASKVQTAQTSTQSSPVSSVEGLVLWLETSKAASFLETEAEDGTAITQWNDTNPQVQHGNNLTTASAGIVYETKGINGLPTIKFSGSQTAGLVGNSITTPYLAYTVFAVYRTDAVDQNAVIYNGATGASATGFGIENDSSGNLNVHDSDKATFTAVTGTTAAVADTGRIATVTIAPNSVNGENVANPAVITYINGAVDASGSLSAQMLTPGPATNFIVGFEDAGTDVEMDGEISEIIVFDHVLKRSDRQAIEAYLGKKYGIFVSKP